VPSLIPLSFTQLNSSTIKRFCPMMNESIQTIMSQNLVTLNPGNTLADARALLMEKHIHHVPIVDGRKLVGIISSWDIFKLGKSTEELAGIIIQDVMKTKLATLEPDQHIGAAAEVLMEHLFHAVPVVNEDKELLGIVTTTDILRYEYRKEYPENLDKFVQDNM